MNDGWTIAGSLGEVVAGAASVVGLFFVGFQIRQATKSEELTTLVAFYKDVTEIEDRLERSEDKRKTYFEFLNFLETYAAACNSDLPCGKAKEMIVEKVCTSIAVIQNTPDLHNSFTESITSSSTFTELVKFIQLNQLVIAKLTYEQREVKRVGR